MINYEIANGFSIGQSVQVYRCSAQDNPFENVFFFARENHYSFNYYMDIIFNWL